MLVNNKARISRHAIVIPVIQNTIRSAAVSNHPIYNIGRRLFGLQERVIPALAS
jgi:hypothetical protein